MITLGGGRWETSEPYSEESLSYLMWALQLGFEDALNGWGKESARLFSIDTAMSVLRRNDVVLAELDRQMLADRLHEARRMTVNGRDLELSYVQNTLETYLNHSWSPNNRSIWLTAINSLLPSPYRAAEATVRAALVTDGATSSVDLIEVLRQRLRARLSEGLLLAEPVGTLFVTA